MECLLWWRHLVNVYRVKAWQFIGVVQFVNDYVV